MNDKLWGFGSLLLLVFCLAPVCREDLRTRCVPQKWCIALGASGLVLALARTLLRVLLIYRRSWGDVKLMAALGAALGLFPFLRGMALTGVLSLAAALFLLIVKKAKPSDTLPFAPFLAAGAVLSEVLELLMEG